MSRAKPKPLPRDWFTALQTLKQCRDAVLRTLPRVKYGSDYYKAVEKIQDGCDDAAEALTGDKEILREPLTTADRIPGPHSRRK